MNITQLTRGGPNMENKPIFQPGKLFNWTVHTLPRLSQKILSVYLGHITDKTKTTKVVTITASTSATDLKLYILYRYINTSPAQKALYGIRDLRPQGRV